MFLAAKFPGLSGVIEVLLRQRPDRSLEPLTPEETNALVKAGERTLKQDAEGAWAHTKVIAQAAGARVI